jgi:hypothetical protein
MKVSIRGALISGMVTMLLSSGCLSVGRQFPIQPVRDIRIGDTTREDVRRTFGAPWRTGIDDGLRTWTYGHYRYAALGPSMTRDLVIRFDDRDVVVSYTFNSTYPEDELR